MIDRHATRRWPAIGCLAVIGLLAVGCRPDEDAPATAGALDPPALMGDQVERPRLDFREAAVAPAVRADTSSLSFREALSATGIDFEQVSGDDAEKNFPTANGSGVAMFDYDEDGHMDLYFATTRPFPLDASSRSRGNRLYRSRGDGTFEDVTEAAGVGYNGFTHGLSTGDVNDDGHVDLFLTNYGPNVLYLNNGDGTFRDGSSGFGGVHPPWSSGSAFLDYDGDGDLDLYVSCYGVWTPESNQVCGINEKIRTYCTPLRIMPARDYLFRNEGNATFVDVTEELGLARHDGRGMGVLAVDVNLDGHIDLFVANDLSPNYLFLNRGDGTFDDISEVSGASASEAGANQAGMGVDAEDLDHDGLPELFVTHFQRDYDTLYKNLDGENFQDVTAATGTARFLDDVGWACSLGDFDLDGQPDMMVFNGHVDNNLDEESGGPQPEVPNVWRGLGGIRFEIASDPGPHFGEPQVCRGAAFGDIDNDGDLDVVVSRLDRTPALLINESKVGRWVGFELVGTISNHDAIGARLTLRSGDKVIHRQVKGGGSYHSANDRRVVFGLGTLDRVDEIEIEWPSGGVTKLSGPEAGRYHRVVEPETREEGANPLSSRRAAE